MQRLSPGCLLIAFVLTACTGTSAPPRGAQEAVRETPPACESHDDCVMSCIEQNDCCMNPCGCNVVRHRETHESVSTENARYCAAIEVECPDVGGCAPDMVYATPRCVLGKCVAELPAAPTQ